MKYSNIEYSIVWFIISIVLCTIKLDNSMFWVHSILVVANIYSYYRCIRIWVAKGCSYLSLYTFFVLYMCASNLGQSIVSLISSSINDLSIYEQFNMDEIVAALKFQLLCVAGFGLGTSIWINRNSIVNKNILILNYQQIDPISFGQQTILKVLFILSVVLVSTDALSYLTMRQSMGYMDAYTERQLDGIPIYMQFANWLIILLGFYFAFTKRYTKFINGIFITLILIFLVCGNRSLTIRYLAFLMVLNPIAYPKYFEKKYLILWSVLGLFFISLLSVISAARNDVGTALQYASGQQTVGDMLMSSLSEMGGSVNTLIYTMDAINKGFHHHLTELYFAITAFSTSQLCYIFGIGDEFLPLGEWVGEYAGIQGYGLGYSCIAEWFMNYGWFGCIFAIFYGYFITMAECVSYRKIANGNYIESVVLLTFLCSQIFYARSSMFNSLIDVRFGFWLIVIYKIIHHKR